MRANSSSSLRLSPRVGAMLRLCRAHPPQHNWQNSWLLQTAASWLTSHSWSTHHRFSHWPWTQIQARQTHLRGSFFLEGKGKEEAFGKVLKRSGQNDKIDYYKGMSPPPPPLTMAPINPPPINIFLMWANHRGRSKREVWRSNENVSYSNSETPP